MSIFKERVNQARQVKEAAAHQKKIDAKKKKDEVEAKEKAEIKRVEAVKKTPEWKAMVKISQNPEFLEALEMYWEKFAQKQEIVEQEEICFFFVLREEISRKQTFEEALKITEQPEQIFPNEELACGRIDLSFLLYSDSDWDGSKIREYGFFRINYNKKNKKVVIRTDGNKFDNLDKFLDYMAEKIA